MTQSSVGWRLALAIVPRVARVVRLLAVMALLGMGCAAAAEDRTFDGLEIEPTPIPDVVLTDVGGQPYDIAASAQGNVTLVYFGYTNCPDICPIHLAQLTEVLSRPGMPANVEVVFITTDPSRDTPEVIRDYLAAYDADYVGLTGTEEELVAAQEAFGAIVAVRETDDENYTMGHDGRVFAFAPSGVGYTQYPHPTRQSAWVHDLPLLAERVAPGDTATEQSDALAEVG